MCLGCWEDAGKPFDASDRARMASLLFADADPFGPLHIVVGDWNLDDESLQFCLTENPSESERELLRQLTEMSEAERWATVILADNPNFDPAADLE